MPSDRERRRDRRAAPALAGGRRRGHHVEARETAESWHIHMYCREMLAPHEVPKAFEFVDDLPLTATSKLRKVELRNRFINLFGG